MTEPVVTREMIEAALDAYSDNRVHRDVIDAMEAAILAALKVAPSPWRPIEGAPRDGTPLLLYLRSEPDRNYLVKGLCPNTAIGFWLYERWQSIEVADCGSMGGEMTGWMEDWCSLDLDPTHFQFLPQPPGDE